MMIKVETKGLKSNKQWKARYGLKQDKYLAERIGILLLQVRARTGLKWGRFQVTILEEATD